MKCKICECEFPPVIDKHYVSRDKDKTGLSTVINRDEPILYDTFDCPICGCQVIAQERKRNYISYTPSLKEDDEDDE